LVLAATEAPSATGEYLTSLLLAYTSSRPRTGPVPPGVFPVSRDEAKAMGQDRAFVIDARRLALVPLTSEWFGRLADVGGGVRGRAPKAMQGHVMGQVMGQVTALLERRPENVEKLGPLWPRRT
jgi:hypothetical protein